jgi:uncharacterized protein
MSPCAVIVFAKAPRAGHAKTRLIPALGADGAAQLAERLLQHAVAQAVAACVGPVELCVTPDAIDHALRALAERHPVTLSAQGDGDLGQRMARAFERVLRSHRRALLIGTDAPGLDAAYLQRGACALDDADAVFGPAADGGYTLVGLRQPAPGLFAGMRWSHDQVMAQTRDRIARLGLRHVELPLLHDIDEPADLAHVPASWRAGLRIETNGAQTR